MKPAVMTRFMCRHPAIAGLVAHLPTRQSGWTDKERNEFMAVFNVVLDYSIPIVPEQGRDGIF
jgi:hypothetical protein